jgi:hypothetical protein
MSAFPRQVRFIPDSVAKVPKRRATNQLQQLDQRIEMFPVAIG